MADSVQQTTDDPDGEWVAPSRIEIHWIDPATGADLGTCVTCGTPSRAAWVGLYGNKWIELFQPRSVNYARPN